LRTGAARAIDLSEAGVFVAGMFMIIGGDGKEYGPATPDQIRSWIKAGRANLETKAKALGSEEWRRLGDFAEFAPPSDTPPVISAEPAFTSGETATPFGTTTPFSTTSPFGNATAAAAGPALADRGARLLARAIDWFIEMLCAIPGGIILGGEIVKFVIAASQGKEPDLEQFDVPRLILGASVLVGAWLILLAVQVWMLATRGQSIGKRLLGIRVVKLDGSPAGLTGAWVMREALITAIGMFAGFIPFIGPILLRPAFHVTDWCLIFCDDQRCLHDKLAGTKVVKA
jgi:uncharacterized RDD family membrane protein YckC